MKLSIATASLLVLAVTLGACRGGGHSSSATPASPVSTAAPGQTAPPDAGATASAPGGTAAVVVGPISREEAFSTYLSGASVYEIDLGTKQIYVYNADPPPYARARPIAPATGLISPDRTWSAASGGTREIVVAKRGVPPAYRITTPGDASWSPVGHTLAFGSNVCGGGHLQLLDVDTGAVRDVTPDVRGALGYAWSPDGASIAVETSTRSGPFKILLVDVAAGTSETLVQVPASRGGEFAPVAFDTNGGRLAFTYIPGRDFCDQFPPPTKFERLP